MKKKAIHGQVRPVVSCLEETVKRLKFELLMVSKLAADTPMFYNPFNVAQAKNIRDKVLHNADDYV